MEPYIELLIFILMPALVATLINRFVLTTSVGNMRVVAYKLYRIAAILAIASQIHFAYGFEDFAVGYYFLKYIGYVLMFTLVFDLFLIYPKKTNPNVIMIVSNISLWVVGLLFFISIIDHFKDIQSNTDGAEGGNIWKEKGSFYGLNPVSNLKVLWERRVLPKIDKDMLHSQLKKDTMLFNLFSSLHQKIPNKINK
jgi:hypothetical protein